MKISSYHPEGTPQDEKRKRLDRERGNHRAIIMGFGDVHKLWYSVRRFRNGKKQVEIYTGRDTVVWLYTAIRSAPAEYDMTRAHRVRQGVMLIRNRLRPGSWTDEELATPVERGTIQSDITMDMLKKAQRALELATDNAMDFRKDFAQSLWNLHTLLTEQILLLRPRLIPNYLPPLDEMLDLSHIRELPPGVDAEPEYTPEMTPEYIAKRRAERTAWHIKNRDHVAALEAGFKLDKPIEELNPNYKRNPATVVGEDEY